MEMRKQFHQSTFAIAVFYLWLCFIKDSYGDLHNIVNGVTSLSRRNAGKTVDKDQCMCDVNAKSDDRGNCHCKKGYYGDGFACFSSPCHSAPCLNGATCEKVGDEGNYTCVCSIGFTGEKCERKVLPCPEICETNNRYTSADLQTCQTSVACKNDGKCSMEKLQNQSSIQKCDCLDGFKGSHCEETAMNCSSNPCQHQGSCNISNNTIGFKCICTEEYIGVLCQERKYQSYLNYPRIHFMGSFQADVSTVNNQPNNYDTTNFDDRQYEYDPNLGGWNPFGSGHFRIVDASVVRVCKKDGKCNENDEMVGAKFVESTKGTAAKLVDIDPDAQVVSEIWGLSIEIEDFLRGDFQRTSFQYMWPKMSGVTGMHGLGARYQSVMTNVRFGPNVGFSKVATEMMNCIGKKQELSIAFNLDLMDVDLLSKSFTYGRIVGSIGINGRKSYPYFNVGRMMKPIQKQNNNFQVNNFQFILTESTESDESDERIMLIDLGNSLPINEASDVLVEKSLSFGLIPKDNEISCSNVIFPRQGHIFKPTTDEYLKWSGIYEISVPSGKDFNTTEKRLVLCEAKEENRNKQCLHVLAAEDKDGINIHPKSRWVFRTEHDKPVHVELFLTIYGGIPTQSGDVKVKIHPPDVKPRTNFNKTEQLSFVQGICTFQIIPEDPKNIRGYIDGQMYQFHYTYTDDEPFDLNNGIFILVWNKFVKPSNPNWITHIRPIFLQYRNLYPVMRENFIDLGNYYDVVKHKDSILKTMNLSRDNPNFMPVTRDLSLNKTEMIKQWLQEKEPPKGLETSNVINMDTLRYLLQIAMQLEHATIPVYLNGYLSIKPGQNGEVADLLYSIIIQEMFHMAQAANLLNAFGGNPNLLDPHFIIPYPTYLPAGVLPDVQVTINKLSLRQIETVYMGIERPFHEVDEYGLTRFISLLEEITVGNGPLESLDDFFHNVQSNQTTHHNTIGEVYQGILFLIYSLNDTNNLDFFDSVKQLKIGTEVIRVRNMSDSVKAIENIVKEGEGASPCNPLMTKDKNSLSHYFKFASIIRKRFVEAILYKPGEQQDEQNPPKRSQDYKFAKEMICNGSYDYVGSPIHFYEGGVWSLVKNPKMSKYQPGTKAYKMANSFNVMYRGLLMNLQNVFNGNIDQFDACIGQMKALLYYGKRLVQTPIQEGGDPDVGPNAAPTYTL